MKGKVIIWGTIQAALHALESRAQCPSAHQSRLQRSFLTRQFRVLFRERGIKAIFLAGIFGCPTVRKFRDSAAAVAGLWIVALALAFRFPGVAVAVVCFCFGSMGVVCAARLFGRAWVVSKFCDFVAAVAVVFACMTRG
jgi:hypothetical protein